MKTSRISVSLLSPPSPSCFILGTCISICPQPQDLFGVSRRAYPEEMNRCVNSCALTPTELACFLVSRVPLDVSKPVLHMDRLRSSREGFVLQ